MRKEPLLTVAPAPILGLPELYAVAFRQAKLAAERYGACAEHLGEVSEALKPILDVLASRENARVETIDAACVEACGRSPDLSNLPTTFADLVPAQELDDVARSGLSTPYSTWALAVGHRQRAFIYWTYVAALAQDPSVNAAAEGLALEALADGNQLRQERRLAWRSERKSMQEDRSGDGDASAALLESLLRRDVVAWSQTLPPRERKQLLLAETLALAPPASALLDDIKTLAPHKIAEIKKRALRRAEQLSNVYLDEADRAKDQSSLEFAQQLAARSIIRLARLHAATVSSTVRSSRTGIAR